MRKYCDIERGGNIENKAIFDYPDDEIIVEEKVDGGNGCFFVGDGVLHVCSRNRDLTAEKDDKTFSASRKWLVENLDLSKLDANYFYYFEHMQKHSISYEENAPKVIGFDVIPKEGAFGREPKFLGRTAKEEAFKAIGVPVVALVWRGKTKEITPELTASWLEKSSYYPGKPEGFVAKNYARENVYGRQMFMKVVNEGFSELNKACFGGAKKDTSDTLKLVEYAVTPARVRKRVLELVDNGSKLDRNLMKFVPMAVIRDVFKEEGEFILKLAEVDIVVFKSLAAKKCLAEIDAMICEKGAAT